MTSGDGDDAGPVHEIPIVVPETAAEFEERKRAAERPDPPGADDGGAQTDRAGDRDGGSPG